MILYSGIELTSELDSKGASTILWISMHGSCFELIYHDEMGYVDWIRFRFTFVYKGILVTMHFVEK